MRSCRSLLTCLLLSLMSLSSLARSGQAQNRASFPWWNSPVIADLGLREEQSQKIRSLVRSYRGRLLDARNTARKAEEDLDDLLNDSSVTAEEAKPVIERVAASRATASRVFLEMSVQLRGVLTLEQWRTLVRRWDEVQKKRFNDTQAPP